MPTPAKASSPDTMLLIGQLLEAAKAAGDGLKTLGAEIQTNGKALIAAVKTIELVEETVAALDRLVRTGNGDSIVTRLAILRTEVTELTTQLGDLEDRVRTVSTLLTSLDETRQRLNAGGAAAKSLAQAVAWVVATGIAVYAAVKP